MAELVLKIKMDPEYMKDVEAELDGIKTKITEISEVIGTIQDGKIKVICAAAVRESTTAMLEGLTKTLKFVEVE